jgi:hypothetical protein
MPTPCGFTVSFFSCLRGSVTAGEPGAATCCFTGISFSAVTGLAEAVAFLSGNTRGGFPAGFRLFVATPADAFAFTFSDAAGNRLFKEAFFAGSSFFTIFFFTATVFFAGFTAGVTTRFFVAVITGFVLAVFFRDEVFTACFFCVFRGGCSVVFFRNTAVFFFGAALEILPAAGFFDFTAGFVVLTKDFVRAAFLLGRAFSAGRATGADFFFTDAF